MSPLSLLSKYQLIAFLAVWCDLKDATLLDSAVCIKNERKMILDMLLNETPFLQYYPCRDEGPLIVWLWVRKIKLSSVALYESGVSMSSFIACDHIFRLSISECTKNISSHKIASLINRCSRLAELSIIYVSEFNPGTCELVNIRILNQLSKVRFEVDCDQGLFMTFARVCQNLDSFDLLTRCTFYENDGDVLAFFKNNQQLQKLTMRLVRSKDFFQAVLEHAPLLREIKFECVKYLCITTLVMFLAKHNQVLEKISITTTLLWSEEEYVDGKLLYDKVTGTLALSYYAHDWSPLLTTISGVKHFRLKELYGHYECGGSIDDFIPISDQTLRHFIDNNCSTLESICIGFDILNKRSNRYNEIIEYSLNKCCVLKHLILPEAHHRHDFILPATLEKVPKNKIEHLEFHSHVSNDDGYLSKILTLLPHLRQFTYREDYCGSYKNKLDELKVTFPHVSFVGKKYSYND